MAEANNQTEQVGLDDFDARADAFLDEAVGKEPVDSSSTKFSEAENVEQDSTSGAEPAKTEQVQAVEQDRSLSVEEKIEKVKEILGDDQDAIDAYVKSKGYHQDPAWQKQREQIDRLKQELDQVTKEKPEQDEMERINRVLNSPTFIRAEMKEQGYTDEAIDSKLREMGHNVPAKSSVDGRTNDLDVVLSKLNVDVSQLSDQQKADISDIVKITRAVVEDSIGKVLPKEIEPLKQHAEKAYLAERANEMLGNMEEMVTAEKILDFKKDVLPVLADYMKKNPKATQDDVMDFFKETRYKLSIDRLKKGVKRHESDSVKTQLAEETRGTNLSTGKLPAKTGNFDKDADAFFDSLGIAD